MKVWKRSQKAAAATNVMLFNIVYQAAIVKLTVMQVQHRQTFWVFSTSDMCLSNLSSNLWSSSRSRRSAATSDSSPTPYTHKLQLLDAWRNRTGHTHTDSTLKKAHIIPEALRNLYFNFIMRFRNFFRHGFELTVRPAFLNEPLCVRSAFMMSSSRL